MSLRPYQQDALQRASQRFKDGIHNQLFVFPTGSGKTQIVSHLPEALGYQRGEQMLFCVHRSDLVDQSVAKFRKNNPRLLVDIEQADRRANRHADIIVASIQSLARDNRLQRYDPQQFKYIFIDEAHVIPGSSHYDKVIKYFRAFNGEPNYDPSKYLGGCTATPDRPDGKALGYLFDEIVASADLLELMRTGIEHNGQLLTWLAEPKAYSVSTEVDLDKVRRSGGDFDIADLEKAVNNPYRNKIIADEYREKGEGRPAICFTVDIQHAKDVAKAFCDAGLPADYVEGATPSERRQALYAALRHGELKCLSSCGVMSLGLDLPEATVGLMARPTQSGLLYRQQAGRIMRPYPSPEEIIGGVPHTWRKQFAIVIDFVDVSIKHKLVTTPTLLGLGQNFQASGKRLTKLADEVEEIKAKHNLHDLEQFKSMDAITAHAKRIDLLAPVPQLPHAFDAANFLWTPEKNGFFISSGEEQVFHVTETPLGQYDVKVSKRGVASHNRTVSSLHEAIQHVEAIVPKEAIRLLDKNAAWRKQPPSPEQLRYFAQLYPELRRVYNNYEGFCAAMATRHTKGEISALIEKAKADGRKPIYTRWRKGSAR